MNPKTSTDLFNKIRSQFTNIRIGDENGAATADPASATFFEFEFKEDQDTFGSVSISLADGENMKVFYNRNLVDKIDEDSKDEWYAFLKELKDFAVEHQLRFDVRDITKSGLTKQDYQNIADTNKTVNTDEMSEELKRITKLAGVEVKEGLTGTAKRSYENLDKTRLIIRHTGKVDETVPGARSRQIQSLYIENEDGERFKYPITHLAGARAMTRHVANGGRPHDEFGQHIVSTSEDIAKLNSFSRYASNKDQLNDNAGDIIEQTKLKLENLRTYVKNLSKQSHYEEASKSFKTSEEQILDDETVAKLREKFTMKNLDGRVEEALPLIHRIMSELEKPKDGEDEEEGTPNSTIPTDQVNELDPGDEPIDAEPEKYVDAGDVVKKFLADPNSKILLNKNMPDEKIMKRPDEDKSEAAIRMRLSDIASRMLTRTPDEDRVANFASRVADQMAQKGEPFAGKDVVDGPGFDSRNRDLAKALAMKYIKTAQEIDPAEYKAKKDIKGKAKETEAFENWVNNIDKVEEDKGSTLASRMIRKAAMDDPDSMDFEVYKTSADMLDAGDIEEFGKYLYKQDTAPREFVMKKLADHDPETFKKVYGDQEGYLATMKPKGMEGMTFEDIKPYVSMYKGDDGKMVYDVLDKDSNSAFKTPDAKAAMKYLSQNFDKLKRPAKTEVEQEAEQIQSKVDAEDGELTRISQLANY